MKTLETGFLSIPDTVQTSVYWYWLSDNISKQGVIKDLEAMKKVGINRAFIGNIGLEGIVPYGKVKLFSPEWWEILHTALKTASKLGIEIGIFNSPGWSQSGGPWVKPEQSMRYLASSEIQVKGPVLIQKKLHKPDPDFQDVRVIAYPAPEGINSSMRHYKLKLKSIPSLDQINNLVDENKNTSVKFSKDNLSTLYFSTDQPYTVRSLMIYLAHTPTKMEGDVQVKTKKGYQTIRHFIVDRTHDVLAAGFNPYGPAAVSLPASTAKEFRLVFTKISASCALTEIKFSSAPVVEDYMEKTLAKMWQDPYPIWSAYQWKPQPVINALAYVVNPAEVIDISKYMSAEGSLNWKVPAGNWIIERTGMCPTKVLNSPVSPEGTGLETDKMSKKHIVSNFNAFLGEIIRRIPAEDRKTWKVTVVDSYEAGGQNWSDGLISKFKRSFGYSPVPYLPVLQGKVVGSADQSDRFLWDLRRFVADNLAYEYVAGLREVSHKYGLTTWLENYGHVGFPGEFLQYGGQSDEVSGEFWNEGRVGAVEIKAASSCAHIYGKNKVSCESFTCEGPAYSRYPAVLKQRADRSFAEGVNNTLLHVYIQQPDDILPGIHAWFGNEFHRLNTWFFDMDLFIQYVKRCNLMLQQGKYVADVAYFISEDAPKMTGIQDPALPPGYSFDYINAEVIKTRMTVKDGKILLPDGMNYRILVLPQLKTMRPELLQKIKELVNQGAVIMGPRPLKSPSLQHFRKADQKVKQLSTELWGKINGTDIKINHFGKGMVIDGMSLSEALKLVNTIPDVKMDPADSTLFIHRNLRDGDIYFISNQRNTVVNIKPAFRTAGKSPELWDATTGQIRALPNYSQTNTATTVPLQLAAYESAFVIFRKTSKPAINENQFVYHKPANYPELIKSILINDDWLVNFDTASRGPSKPVLFKQLEDWTLSTNDSIKYYSGTAFYQRTFNTDQVQKNESIILDLGRVSVIAKVKVNGIDMGGVWTSPYQVDITNAVKPGRNKLEIKVVNTWMNRLIGDSKLPRKERPTRLFYGWHTPATSLYPSGLSGPVKINIMKKMP